MIVLIVLAVIAGLIYAASLVWLINEASSAPLIDHRTTKPNGDQHP